MITFQLISIGALIITPIWLWWIWDLHKERKSLRKNIHRISELHTEAHDNAIKWEESNRLLRDAYDELEQKYFDDTTVVENIPRNPLDDKIVGVYQSDLGMRIIAIEFESGANAIYELANVEKDFSNTIKVDVLPKTTKAKDYVPFNEDIKQCVCGADMRSTPKMWICDNPSCDVKRIRKEVE